MNSKDIITVCYFGIYKPEYSRNKILISGLKSNGVSILECRTGLMGILKYFDLIKKHWKIRKDYDVMLVAFPGFQSVILAKFLTRKPIVFDAFISMYDSIVLDRKLVRKYSLKAKYFWWLDKLSFMVADLVIIDTNEHKKYLSKEFRINSKKIERVFLGADTNIFYPREEIEKNQKFKVMFYGTYIPLQGIEYIVKAAKILENDKDIIFELIGDGQEKSNILELAKELKIINIVFKGNLSISELANRIFDSDVCLGIFGNTEKTKRVIPNKVYECVAMKKPVITCDTPAERELFNDDELFFTKIADPESISNAIIKIKNNKILRNNIAENGYSKFVKNVIPDRIGFHLKEILKNF